MKPKKLLLVYTHYSSFVATDEQILSSHYEVTRYRFVPARGALAVAKALIHQLFFLALNIRKFDLVYIWFADQHSLLPVLFARLMGRRSFLVIGGYDVCRIRTLNYGVFCSKPRGWAAVTSMKMSTLNLAVSHHVARKVKALTRKENLQMVHNCVNLPENRGEEAGVAAAQAGEAPPTDKDLRKRESSRDEAHERRLVLTVAKIDSERTFRLKGIDTFVGVARLLPHIPFCIAGFSRENAPWLTTELPPNVTTIGEVDHDRLPAYYRQTMVYCQFSRSESFGIALAEAMLYACIPLATNEGGMPEVVGDKQLLVKRNHGEIALKIDGIFQEKNKTGSFASLRIRELFSVENRSRQLMELLK